MNELRLSRFTVFSREESGRFALWNSLSGAFRILPAGTARALREGALEDLSPQLREELLRCGILCREEEELPDLRTDAGPLQFRILTTTACNARCDYCYEKGAALLSMSPETAEQTLRFLLSRAEKQPGRPLRLEWFGGEPLLNPAAISRICGGLAAAGQPWRSSLVTNGLLLDPELIPRAREQWRLTGVQITLDGPPGVYEAVKHLPPGSFEKLLERIPPLLEAGIRVSLRVNHASSRLEQERQLIEELSRRFPAPSPLLRVYLFPLYERRQAIPAAPMEEILLLNRRLVEAGLACGESLYAPPHRRNGCFACCDGGLTVAPDGRLYNCSHCMTPEQCLGSVWQPEEDGPCRRAFLRSELGEACRSCALLPVCMGGCRSGELGLAPMPQCYPYKSVLPEMLRERMRFQRKEKET